MATQSGRHFHGKILVDSCGSQYYNNGDVNRKLNQVGLEGKEHNMIVSLRFRIIEYFRKFSNEGIMEHIKCFVSIKIPCEQIFLAKEDI